MGILMKCGNFTISITVLKQRVFPLSGWECQPLKSRPRDGKTELLVSLPTLMD